MEAYLSAAGKISRLAIGSATARRRRPSTTCPEDATPELPRRGSAVRHARRHPDQARVSGRRRVRLQDRSRSTKATWGRRTTPSARSPGEQLEVIDRRRAGASVRLGQGDGAGVAVRSGVPTPRDPRQGGPAHGRRHVPRHQLRARQRPEPRRSSAPRSRPAAFPGITFYPARRQRPDRRTVRRRRAPTTRRAAARFSCAGPTQPRRTKRRARGTIVVDAGHAAPSGVRRRRRTSAR